MSPHRPLAPAQAASGPAAVVRAAMVRAVWARAALAGTVAAALGACAPERAVTGSLYPREVQQRHPIVLADAPRNLDVFIQGSGQLDPRQGTDVRAFAAEYRQSGSGPLLVQVPLGSPGARVTLGGVRQAMAEVGVGGRQLALSTYDPLNRALASPIRLTFRRLQAKVASRCGQWPQDLGGTDLEFNAGNDPYWNLGCATQSNFAAQVADPIDLVRGRSMGRGDTIRRTKDIENLRQGKDPSTTYRQDDKGKITQSVGN